MFIQGLALNNSQWLYDIKPNQQISKVGDLSRGWPEVSRFKSYYTGVLERGATPFAGLLQFTLDPYLMMLRATQGGIKYHFWVFDMIRLGIERRSSGSLANTLHIRLMASYKQINTP